MTTFSVLWILLIPFVASLRTSPLNTWTPRIINGTEAVVNNTRHQVSIRSKSSETIFGTGHICGGSLIAPTIVLSAAHCFYDELLDKYFSAQDYFVVMGTLDRFEPNDDTLSFNITHIVYNDFHRPTFRNDIAVLFLDGTVPSTNPSITTIPLNKAVIPAGTMCQVTGWGMMETGMYAEVLMTVDVPVIDSKTCSTNYGEGSIVDGMICAGYMEGEKDSCLGDSGGPLVHNGKLIGIVSFGDGCAKPGYPGVYADVRYYADWIEKTIKSKSSAMSASTIFIILSAVLVILHSKRI